MQIQTLGAGLDSVAAEDGVLEETSPFIRGRSVGYAVNCNGFTGTVLIQGSDDDSTYTTLATIVGASATHRTAMGSVALQKYMRANVTVRSAGEVDVHLLAASS